MYYNKILNSNSWFDNLFKIDLKFESDRIVLIYQIHGQIYPLRKLRNKDGNYLVIDEHQQFLLFLEFFDHSSVKVY